MRRDTFAVLAAESRGTRRVDSNRGRATMRIFTRGMVMVVGIATLTAAQCTAPGSSSASDPARDTGAARAQLVRLEADAKALVNAGGCSATNQCRMAPVGARACGGPRRYFAYCTATTDSGALFRKLDELKAAEIKFNQSVGASSTCDFRTPPGVVADGGSCRASASP